MTEQQVIIANIALVVAIVITVVIVLALLYKMNRREIVRTIILSLVTQAEKAFGSGTGELKYAYVIDKLYDKLPGIIKILYTKKDIDIYIEDSVKKLKEILERGNTLSGYDDERFISKLDK